MEVFTRKDCHRLSAVHPVNLSSSGGSWTVGAVMRRGREVSFVITSYRDDILKLILIYNECVNTAVGQTKGIHY